MKWNRSFDSKLGPFEILQKRISDQRRIMLVQDVKKARGVQKIVKTTVATSGSIFAEILA